MVIAHSLLPLRIATLLGVAASFLNLLYLGYILAVVIVKQRIAEGWLTTSLSHTVMFLVLFLILAVLAEYIGRTLEEAKDQPLYFIERESSSAVSCYDKSRLNIV
jgi:dolichol-phosphate mannosyltransferase